MLYSVLLYSESDTRPGPGDGAASQPCPPKGPIFIASWQGPAEIQWYEVMPWMCKYWEQVRPNRQVPPAHFTEK